MNGTVAKATRREIRRAFGPQAVHAIAETHQNTQATVQSVAFAHERLDRHDKGFADLAAILKRGDAAAQERIDGVIDSEDARWTATNEAQRRIIDRAREDSEPLRRGFWGRLHWLLRGR